MNFRIDPDGGAPSPSEAPYREARDAREGEIPIIDLRANNGVIADQVCQACERIGFFYVVNHGVEKATIETAFAQARWFFEQSEAYKAALAFNRLQRGYKTHGDIVIPGHPPDLKEVFDMGVDLPEDHPDAIAGKPLHGPNQWPDSLDFKSAMQCYFDAVVALGHRLTQILATALDLDASYFDRYHRQPFITWRVMTYPPHDNAPGQFGTAPHTDFGTLTILAQDDSGGLEVFSREQEWIRAPVVSDAFVINIGDFMAYWTNDRFTSTPHRVINRSNRQRYSIPLFFNPSFDTLAECLPSCQSADNPPS